MLRSHLDDVGQRDPLCANRFSLSTRAGGMRPLRASCLALVIVPTIPGVSFLCAFLSAVVT